MKVYPIVHVLTKAWIKGRYLPVLIVINYATLLGDSDETESLAVSFDIIKYGSAVDMKPINLGGDGGLYVGE